MRIYYPGEGPIGSPELRLIQLEAIYRIKQEITDPTRTGSVLVGAGMGSGKTVVTIEVILKTQPKRCLIVGVARAYTQWAKAMREQGGTRPILRIDGTVPGRDNLLKLLDGDDGIFYVGLEMLRAQDWDVVSETYPIDPELKEMFGEEIGDFTDPVKRQVQRHTYDKMKPLDLLISDESHKHSNQKSVSIKTIAAIRTKGKIALSGTFFGNKFENAWSVCVWLWGKTAIGNKGPWTAQWCEVAPVMSKDGRRQLRSPGGFPLTKVKGERFPGEFVKTLPCYVFIPTPIGPVPLPEIVKVKLSKEQLRQYEEMERQSLTWIPSTISSKREPLVADLPITQRQRLRTAALGGMTLVPGLDDEDPDSIIFEPGCSSSTLNEAYNVLHRPSWVGKKVLILTHSKQFAIEAARRIGQKYPTALKTGDVVDKQWQIDKARFELPVSETDSIQYLVAVISAVGTATDGLQTNCAKVLWLSEDDNNVNNIQADNRVWRDGVDLDEYECIKLIQSGTISEGIIRKNNTHRDGVLDTIAGSQ